MAPALPHSPAAERNAAPILAVLREHFADCTRVLEIGSGTGQHAVHFAAALPHLTWQPTDLAENHALIRARIEASRLANVLPPRLLDAARADSWPLQRFDALFSANTLHIMAWPEVRALFATLPSVLEPHAVVVIYGPFNVGGRYTSPSNAEFDAQLRQSDPRRGIRDLEAVNALAADAGLALVANCAMPANNQCLVWRSQATPP